MYVPLFLPCIVLTAVQTPLGFNDVYTLAASFITSCPSSNPTLPVQAFPSLTITPSSGTPGSTAMVTYANMAPDSTFVAFLSGFNQTFVPIMNGSVTFPNGLQGTVYALVTNDSSSVTDATTLAGPAILQFPLPSDSQ
jgi:hypothetical protein